VRRRLLCGRTGVRGFGQQPERPPLHEPRQQRSLINRPVLPLCPNV
jgi:hypothetical protein